jgi:hypothetical protein
MATQADIDRLEAARIALAAGEQVQTVRYDGPPARMVQFHPTDLDKLSKLIAQLKGEVARDAAKAAGRGGYTLIATRKGV